MDYKKELTDLYDRAKGIKDIETAFEILKEIKKGEKNVKQPGKPKGK